jgi:hypothetical protein
MFSLTIYFIADAIPHFQLCCVSHTHSLSFCLSAVLLSSPHQLFDIKNLVIHFHLIIDLNKLIRTTLLFYLEVAHNNISMGEFF